MIYSPTFLAGDSGRFSVVSFLAAFCGCGVFGGEDIVTSALKKIP